MRQLLGIPSHYAVLNVVSIGYPNEERKAFDMEKLAFDKVHSEKILNLRFSNRDIISN